MVARRITKPQKCLGSNLTGCSFLFIFFIFIFGGGGGGGGSDFIFLFMSFFSFFLLLFLIPLTCIRHIYKTSVTTQTTVNSEIYTNSVK